MALRSGPQVVEDLRNVTDQYIADHQIKPTFLFEKDNRWVWPL